MESKFDAMFDEEMIDMQDEIIKELGKEISEEDRKMSVVNFKRLKEILFTYEAMKLLGKEANAKVNLKLYKPFRSMGSVSLEGKSLEFYNSELFAEAAKLSSNVEAYPLTNGNIRMTFTFHGLTMPLE